MIISSSLYSWYKSLNVAGPLWNSIVCNLIGQLCCDPPASASCIVVPSLCTSRSVTLSNPDLFVLSIL